MLNVFSDGKEINSENVWRKQYKLMIKIKMRGLNFEYYKIEKWH